MSYRPAQLHRPVTLLADLAVKDEERTPGDALHPRSGRLRPVAGTITRLPGGKLRFDYDEDYRSQPSATPLSVSMPIQVQSHPDRLITPWLWGLLPDNARTELHGPVQSCRSTE